jgi:hypothetical protein
MLACSLVSISSRGSSFSVTFSAIDWSGSVRFEWNLTWLSTFSADCVVHFSWSTIRHSFCTSNSPKELVSIKHYFRNENHNVAYKFIRPQLNRTIMNKRKRRIKTKANQRLHCLMRGGVLVVTLLCFSFFHLWHARVNFKHQTCAVLEFSEKSLFSTIFCY